MDDPREEQIRHELLRSPPPTQTELQRKYRINGNVITRIRGELGFSLDSRRARILSLIAQQPTASDAVIAEQAGVSRSSVQRHRQSSERQQLCDLGRLEQPGDLGRAAQSKAGGNDWKETARGLRAQGKRVGEISRQLGINPGTVSKAVRDVTPDHRPPITGTGRKFPRRPSDPDKEVQWMWRQVKELRISLKYALGRMDDLVPWLTEITEIIDRLRPDEPWLRFYPEGARGYGSLSFFLAERSELDLDNLRARFLEAGNRYHHILSIIDGVQTEEEAHANGTGTDIRD